jgi:flap endonuclease-1
MGVALSNLVPRRPIDLTDLAGKRIAIDALNMIFQFVAVIRDNFTGQPLRDHRGRVTSHLSGLLYRTLSYLEAGIEPVYVFDGPHPDFKARTVAQRRQRRETARLKWEEAVRAGEPAIRYAQAAGGVDNPIVQGGMGLLDLMGVPWIQAPSEGEAQCAWMCRQRMVYATASQDYDSLLFGSSRLVRNLSTSGKRKLPGRNEYVAVKPELIDLREVLTTLGLNRQQLIVVGSLIGTDYHKGIRGIGPKKALQLVQEKRTLRNVMASVDFAGGIDIRQVYDFFLNPPHTDVVALKRRRPATEKLLEFLIAQHDFKPERMEKAVQRLLDTCNKKPAKSQRGSDHESRNRTQAGF